MCKSKYNKLLMLTKVRFSFFSVKRNENEMHRKYRLLAGSAETLPPPSVLLEQNRWFHCI